MMTGTHASNAYAALLPAHRSRSKSRADASAIASAASGAATTRERIGQMPATSAAITASHSATPETWARFVPDHREAVGDIPECVAEAIVRGVELDEVALPADDLPDGHPRRVDDDGVHDEQSEPGDRGPAE